MNRRTSRMAWRTPGRLRADARGGGPGPHVMSRSRQSSVSWTSSRVPRTCASSCARAAPRDLRTKRARGRRRPASRGAPPPGCSVVRGRRAQLQRPSAPAGGGEGAFSCAFLRSATASLLMSPRADCASSCRRGAPGSRTVAPRPAETSRGGIPQSFPRSILPIHFEPDAGIYSPKTPSTPLDPSVSDFTSPTPLEGADSLRGGRGARAPG